MLSIPRLCGAALVAVFLFAGAAHGGEKIPSSGIYTPPADPLSFAQDWETNMSGFEGYAAAPVEALPPQPVPEPATLILLLSGVSALALRSRTRSA